MPWFTLKADVIPDQQIREAACRLVAQAQERIAPSLKRVLLLRPDLTRAHSGAGKVTERVYHEVMARDPRTGCDLHASNQHLVQLIEMHKTASPPK